MTRIVNALKKKSDNFPWSRKVYFDPKLKVSRYRFSNFLVLMSQRIREDSPAEIATLTWLQQSLFRRSKPLESSLSTHAFIVECDRHYNHRVLGGSYFSALRYVPDVSRKKQ